MHVLKFQTLEPHQNHLLTSINAYIHTHVLAYTPDFMTIEDLKAVGELPKDLACDGDVIFLGRLCSAGEDHS
jgi:hypothetical protein